MTNHSDALLLIRRRLRELRFEVDDARDDVSYNDNIESLYIEPLLKEIEGLEASKILLEDSAVELSLPQFIQLGVFELTNEHIGYNLVTQYGLYGEIVDVETQSTAGTGVDTVTVYYKHLDQIESVLFVSNVQAELTRP